MQAIYANQELSSVTVDEWTTIFKYGLMRGLNVRKMAEMYDGNLERLILKSAILSCDGVSIDLKQVKACVAEWTLSRVIYEIVSRIFPCFYADLHKRVNQLAQGVHAKANNCEQPFTRSIIAAFNHSLPKEIKAKIINGDIRAFACEQDVKEAMWRLRVLYTAPLTGAANLEIAEWISYNGIPLRYLSLKERELFIPHLTVVNGLGLDSSEVHEMLPKAKHTKHLAIEDPTCKDLTTYLKQLSFPNLLRSLTLKMPELVLEDATPLEKLVGLEMVDFEQCPKVVMTLEQADVLFEKCFKLKKLRFYEQEPQDDRSNLRIAQEIMHRLICFNLTQKREREEDLLRACCTFQFDSYTNAVFLTVHGETSNINYLASCKFPEKVEKITFNMPLLTHQGIAVLALFPNLKVLDFTGCLRMHYADEGFKTLLTTWANLESITFADAADTSLFWMAYGEHRSPKNSHTNAGAMIHESRNLLPEIKRLILEKIRVSCMTDFKIAVHVMRLLFPILKEDHGPLLANWIDATKIPLNYFSKVEIQNFTPHLSYVNLFKIPSCDVAPILSIAKKVQVLVMNGDIDEWSTLCAEKLPSPDSLKRFYCFKPWNPPFGIIQAKIHAEKVHGIVLKAQLAGLKAQVKQLKEGSLEVNKWVLEKFRQFEDTWFASNSR